MKIIERSFTPKSEQKTALVYSEHSSLARSLHLFFLHESAEQQQFLLDAFKETVRRYLSPSELKPPLALLASLIECYESIQEERGLAPADLQGMGLFVMLQQGGSVYLVTSLDRQVHIRLGDQVHCLGAEDHASFERPEVFDAPTQEELFPRRLRDTLTTFKIAAPAQASLEVVLGCREEELGRIFSAIRDSGFQQSGGMEEVPLDMLSKRALYIRFEGSHASRGATSANESKTISLRAPFGLIHTAAIVATAAVVFIAGAAWIGGRSHKQSSDMPPDAPSQPVHESGGAQPSTEPVASNQGGEQDPTAAESVVDIASTRLQSGWTRRFEQAVTSSPVANGQRVIFGCRDGKMRALNALSGAEMWVHEAAGGIGASPAVADGKVIGADYTGAVFALEIETGNPLWSSKLPGRIVSSPCILDERVVVGCFDNFVYCLSVPDGRVLWNADARGRVWGTAAAADETFFIPSYDGNLYALSSGTGEIKWTYKVGGEVLSSPAVAGGNVVVGGSDGRLHAVDRRSGETAWIFRTGAPINSAIFADGDRIFFGSNDTHVFCLDGRAGTLIWKCKTKGYVLGRPCTADGLIFIGSYDKTMYCLHPETGTVIDRFETSGKIYSSPAANQKLLFFGNNEGEFFCLNYSNERSS